MSEHTTTDRSRRARPSSLGGLVLVIASIVLSAVSYGSLAESIRIRWSIGTYQHYGPEYVSATVVLVLFPALTAGLYVGARRLRAYVERAGHVEKIDEFRAVYDICVLLTLGMVLAVQLAIIILNL